MQLRHIMTLQVRTIGPDATVQQAAQKMDDDNVGALPVCDRGRVIGLVTDRDIVVRSTCIGQDPSTVRVRDVMTAPVISAIEDQDVAEAAVLMKRNYIRRLPVLDRAQQLIGMVTADDLMIVVPERGGDVVRNVAKVERPSL